MERNGTHRRNFECYTLPLFSAFLVIGQNEFRDGFTQLCNERLIAGHVTRDCQGFDMLRSTTIAIIHSAVYSSTILCRADTWLRGTWWEEREETWWPSRAARCPTISSIAAHAKTILFFNVPIPDISTSISFPGFRYRGGFMAKPTPRKKC